MSERTLTERIADVLYDELLGTDPDPHAHEKNAILKPVLPYTGPNKNQRDEDEHRAILAASALGLEVHRSAGDRWSVMLRVAAKITPFVAEGIPEKEQDAIVYALHDYRVETERYLRTTPAQTHSPCCEAEAARQTDRDETIRLLEERLATIKRALGRFETDVTD